MYVHCLNVFFRVFVEKCTSLAFLCVFRMYICFFSKANYVTYSWPDFVKGYLPMYICRCICFLQVLQIYYSDKVRFHIHNLYTYVRILCLLIQVVLCKFHSVFLTASGSVYTSGVGRGGRLGHGNEYTLMVGSRHNRILFILYTIHPFPYNCKLQ